MTDYAAVPNGAEPMSDYSIDGAALLDSVRAFLGRFIAFPAPAARDTVTLWAAHAHFVHRGDNSPRLALLSPEPGSGKTRTLEVLELLTPRPMSVLSASPAAVFRTIEAEQPTLLFDEVDAIFNRRGGDDGAEDLRALLNAGHRRGATIPRCVGPRHDVERFPVYAAAALAGLGDLPDTLMSRAVIVRMRRRAPAEHVEPFRRRAHAAAGEQLADQLAEWADEVGHVVGDAWPELPDGITDRPADCWEPLLALADQAGGHWPETARTACVEMCKVSASREASLGAKLLTDLRDVFVNAGRPDGIHTDTLLTALHELDESPWADLRGKPLDARRLARRLHKYGIHSASVRVGDHARKGYRWADLWDAWDRYLPPLPVEGSQASQGPFHAQPAEPGKVTCDLREVTTEPERSHEPSLTRRDVTAVTAVTLLREGAPVEPLAPLAPDGSARSDRRVLCRKCSQPLTEWRTDHGFMTCREHDALESAYQ